MSDETPKTQLVSLPSPIELLAKESAMLRQMVENIDGEMIQAAVRRESIMWLIQAAENEMARLRENPVAPTMVEFPQGSAE